MGLDDLISELLKLAYEQDGNELVMVQLFSGEMLFADRVAMVDGQPTIIAET